MLKISWTLSSKASIMKRKSMSSLKTYFPTLYRSKSLKPSKFEKQLREGEKHTRICMTWLTSAFSMIWSMSITIETLRTSFINCTGMLRKNTTSSIRRYYRNTWANFWSREKLEKVHWQKNTKSQSPSVCLWSWVTQSSKEKCFERQRINASRRDWWCAITSTSWRSLQWQIW